MKAPDRLMIVDGRLNCRQGSAQKYLLDWMQKRGLPDGTPVCVLTRDDLQRLLDELDLARSVAGIA